MDMATLLRWMEERRAEDEDRRRRHEDRRSHEDEERRHQEEERHSLDDERRMQRRTERQIFLDLITQLCTQRPPASQPQTLTAAPDTSPITLTLPPHLSCPKPIVNPPPTLLPDVFFQAFKKWRRKWIDYPTMVDHSTLPLNKQLIRLHMCPSLEIQHVLQHKLHLIEFLSRTSWTS